MWIYIRSILYCLGRSNASYFDPKIKHLGIRKEHFSWWVYWTYYYHWWFMTYLLTAIYFCRHDSWAWTKEVALETTWMYTRVFQTLLEVSLTWWDVIYSLGKKIHKRVNFVKWTSDWLLMSWFQFNLYRYFRRIRFHFFFKIYWYEPIWVFWVIFEAIDFHFLSEFEIGGGADRHVKRTIRWINEDAQERKRIKNKLPAPKPDRSHIKSLVIINKQVFYSNRRDYYINFRSKSKPSVFDDNNFKNKSKWI